VVVRRQRVNVTFCYFVKSASCFLFLPPPIVFYMILYLIRVSAGTLLGFRYKRDFLNAIFWTILPLYPFHTYWNVWTCSALSHHCLSQDGDVTHH